MILAFLCLGLPIALLAWHLRELREIGKEMDEHDDLLDQ